MELTQTQPRSPYLGFYKTFSAIGVTTIGVMLLTIVALQFSDSTLGIDRLALGVITFGIAVIGIAYYKQRDALNQVDGKIGDSVVFSLCHTANAMACGGYMICIFAIGLVHHH
jgi:hypothetical protein